MGHILSEKKDYLLNIKSENKTTKVSTATPGDEI